MSLSDEELSAFRANGAITRPGFVSPDMIQRATARVTNWYRTEMDRSQLVGYTQRTFAPDLGGHPEILALFRDSGVTDLVRDLVGDFIPVDTAQIQIRLPETEGGDAQPVKAMHVDGVACPHLDPAELRTFSLLVGVVLSDISDAAGGALRYVPGGHLAMAEWFRTEWSLGITDQVPPYVDVERGTPLLGKPGDVLLMHHLVPHSVGRNLTTLPRVMVYFRISNPAHAGRRLEALRDPWLDYPALASRAGGLTQ